MSDLGKQIIESLESAIKAMDAEGIIYFDSIEEMREWQRANPDYKGLVAHKLWREPDAAPEDQPNPPWINRGSQ